MFNKEHCSPRKDKIEHSCLNKSFLIKIAKILNKHFKSKIKIKKASKKKLFEDVSKILKNNSCNSEICVFKNSKISKYFSKSDIENIKTFFRPEKPIKWEKNPNTWLTTVDINNVMEQYEKKYPHFKYYGATPIDFNLKYDDNTCMVSDICNIDINNIKNKKCIGMVFNTDPHNRSGQHWFSMYVDLVGKNMDKPAIYYFDSATPVESIEEIPVQIIKLIEKLQNQSNFMFDIFFNDIKHQHGNTECGMYCLHFITEMLKGKDFLKYIQSNLTDKNIEKYRKKFFINK
jgi:hypothetical protein